MSFATMAAFLSKGSWVKGVRHGDGASSSAVYIRLYIIMTSNSLNRNNDFAWCHNVSWKSNTKLKLHNGSLHYRESHNGKSHGDMHPSQIQRLI